MLDYVSTLLEILLVMLTAAGTGTTTFGFQPFLRFYRLRGHVLALLGHGKFQPFLRFYLAYVDRHAQQPGEVSTLLEILHRQQKEYSSPQ